MGDALGLPGNDLGLRGERGPPDTPHPAAASAGRRGGRARAFEHSGPYFALLTWGSELKQLILYTILANVFLAPWGLASSQHLGAIILAIAALLAKAVAVGCVVAVIDNSFAKLRVAPLGFVIGAWFRDPGPVHLSGRLVAGTMGA